MTMAAKKAGHHSRTQRAMMRDINYLAWLSSGVGRMAFLAHSDSAVGVRGDSVEAFH